MGFISKATRWVCIISQRSDRADRRTFLKKRVKPVFTQTCKLMGACRPYLPVIYTHAQHAPRRGEIYACSPPFRDKVHCCKFKGRIYWWQWPQINLHTFVSLYAVKILISHASEFRFCQLMYHSLQALGEPWCVKHSFNSGAKLQQYTWKSILSKVWAGLGSLLSGLEDAVVWFLANGPVSWAVIESIAPPFIGALQIRVIIDFRTWYGWLLWPQNACLATRFCEIIIVDNAYNVLVTCSNDTYLLSKS